MFLFANWKIILMLFDYAFCFIVITDYLQLSLFEIRMVDSSRL